MRIKNLTVNIMKPILTTFFFLFFGINTGYAQNSVTITQSGKGNQAIINGTNSDSSATTNQNGCQQWSKSRSFKRNKILVQRADGKPDTVVNSRAQRNTVKKFLGKQELAASQYGKGNGLMIMLPDSQKKYKRFHSTQNGSQNRVSAKLNNSINDITLFQRGNNNEIAVNPCESDGTSRHEAAGGKK
jgi:hypothetical protein